MSPVAGSAARERLLVCAEHLFSERGYTAVTLRDVAEAVGIRQASLYHHFPGGKEQLFVAVTEFGLARISTELNRVAADTHTLSLSERLERIALLLLDQPPIDLARMVRSDMPAIAGDVAERLTRRAFDSLVIPIGTVFKEARERGEQRHDNDLLLAGWFLAMIESVQVAERFARRPASLMANEMIDVLIYGVAQRSR
jgi:AcrR family transcriptional regulator